MVSAVGRAERYKSFEMISEANVGKPRRSVAQRTRARRRQARGGSSPDEAHYGCVQTSARGQNGEEEMTIQKRCESIKKQRCNVTKEHAPKSSP